MSYNMLAKSEAGESHARLTGADAHDDSKSHGSPGYGYFFKTPKSLHRGISVAAGATMMMPSCCRCMPA